MLRRIIFEKAIFDYDEHLRELRRRGEAAVAVVGVGGDGVEAVLILYYTILYYTILYYTIHYTIIDIYIYIHMYTYTSLSLSIYIYMYRDR